MQKQSLKRPQPLKKKAIPKKPAPKKKTEKPVAKKPTSKSTPKTDAAKQIQSDLEEIFSGVSKTQAATQIQEIIALAQNPTAANNAILQKLGLSASQISTLEGFLKAPNNQSQLSKAIDEIVNVSSSAPNISLLLEESLPEVLVVILGLIVYAAKKALKKSGALPEDEKKTDSSSTDDEEDVTPTTKSSKSQTDSQEPDQGETSSTTSVGQSLLKQSSNSTDSSLNPSQSSDENLTDDFLSGRL